MKKIVIASIAGLAAVGVTIAIIVAVIAGNKTKTANKPERVTEHAVQTSMETEKEPEETTATSASDNPVQGTGWEYSLKDKSDEEIADELFNTINSFHIGMKSEDWHKTLPVFPSDYDDRNPGVMKYRYLGNQYPWDLEDNMEEITTNYILCTDGTFQIGPNDKIASLSLACRFKDGDRAKHIFDLLFEKLSAASSSVAGNTVRNNENKDGSWDAYAMNTVNGFTWRLSVSSRHNNSNFKNDDGGFTINLEAYAMSWPGMNK